MPEWLTPWIPLLTAVLPALITGIVALRVGDLALKAKDANIALAQEHSKMKDVVIASKDAVIAQAQETSKAKDVEIDNLKYLNSVLTDDNLLKAYEAQQKAHELIVKGLRGDNETLRQQMEALEAEQREQLRQSEIKIRRLERAARLRPTISTPLSPLLHSSRSSTNSDWHKCGAIQEQSWSQECCASSRSTVLAW